VLLEATSKIIHWDGEILGKAAVKNALDLTDICERLYKLTHAK